MAKLIVKKTQNTKSLYIQPMNSFIKLPVQEILQKTDIRHDQGGLLRGGDLNGQGTIGVDKVKEERRQSQSEE